MLHLGELGEPRPLPRAANLCWEIFLVPGPPPSSSPGGCILDVCIGTSLQSTPYLIFYRILMCKTHCDAPCPSPCSSSLTPASLLKAHLGGGGGRPQIQEIPSSRIVLEEILLFSSSWAYPCLLCPCFRGGGAPHRASKEPLAPRGAPAQALHFQFFLKKKKKTINKATL